MSGHALNALYHVHEPHPFLFRFGENFGIRYYGLAYLLGFLGALWLWRLYHRTGRSRVTPEMSLDLLTLMVVGVVAGGRLGEFLLYQPQRLLADPLALFRVWEGGMASHGGFVGVALALVWFSRTRRLPFGHVADVVASVTSLGLMLGRLANYLNGELWGKVTDVRWGVIFEQTGGGQFPRHPSQLYEATLEGALLLTAAQWRFWKTGVTQRHPGQLAGEYLIAYAGLRAIGEVFREPDRIICGLSSGTFYSLFLVAGGLALIAWARRAGSLKE